MTDWLPTLYAAAGGNPDQLPELDGINHWQNLVEGRDTNLRREIVYNINPGWGLFTCTFAIRCVKFFLI